MQDIISNIFKFISSLFNKTNQPLNKTEQEPQKEKVETMPNFSAKSNERLETCADDLQKLFRKVVQTYDCSVLEGHRSPERQLEMYNNGKSKVKFGKHNENPSQAIDISPYPIPDNWGDGNFKELAKFYHFAGFILAKAESMGIKIRWGGDWDSDKDFKDQTFNDLVHFELA